MRLDIPCAIVPPRLSPTGRLETLAPGNPCATPRRAPEPEVQAAAQPRDAILRAAAAGGRQGAEDAAIAAREEQLPAACGQGGGAKRAFVLPIHTICLYYSSRSHAGENLQALLEQREAERDKPLVMSDALSRNEVDETYLFNNPWHG